MGQKPRSRGLSREEIDAYHKVRTVLWEDGVCGIMSLAFLGESSEHAPSKLGSWHPWAYLLRRVFAVDVMTCSSCGGSMKLLKIAEEPDDIARAPASSPRRPASD